MEPDTPAELNDGTYMFRSGGTWVNASTIIAVTPNAAGAFIHLSTGLQVVTPQTPDQVMATWKACDEDRATKRDSEPDQPA